MNKRLILSICFIINSTLLFSFDDTGVNIGFNLGANFNIHPNALDAYTPLSQCCYIYGDGATGFGINSEGLAEIPLFNSFKLDFRFGYSSLSGESIVKEKFDIHNGANIIDVGTAENKLELTARTYRFLPSLKYTIYGKVDVGLGFGFSYLFFDKYHFTQKIIEPDYAYYTDKDGNRKKIVREAEGGLDNLNEILYTGVMYIAYNIELGPWLLLSPEIKYCLPFNNLASDINYKVHTMQAGFSFKFQPYSF